MRIRPAAAVLGLVLVTTLSACFLPQTDNAGTTTPPAAPSDSPPPAPRPVAAIDPIWDESATTQPTSNRNVDCTKVKCIALTFDDGPRMYTAGLLDTLVEMSAPSTFYLLGNLVGSDPDTVATMLPDNNAIGNHSWAHTDLATLSSKAVRKDISDTNAAIEAITGYKPTTMRPPYGSFTDSTVAAIDMPIIYWSVDTADWVAGRNPHDTFVEATGHAAAGQIVLMHDIHANTVKLAPDIIRSLRKQGFTLVTVDQILKPLGMEKDEVYFHGATP